MMPVTPGHCLTASIGVGQVRIQNVAQVVDGDWGYTAAGVRPSLDKPVMIASLTLVT